MNLKKDSVKQLALESGFKLKEQPDGSKDLNPYVYEFADKVGAAVAEDFVVMMRLTYDELSDVVREVDGGSCFKALKILHRLRTSIQEVIEGDERAVIFALMDAIGEALQK